MFMTIIVLVTLLISLFVVNNENCHFFHTFLWYEKMINKCTVMFVSGYEAKNGFFGASFKTYKPPSSRLGQLSSLKFSTCWMPGLKCDQSSTKNGGSQLFFGG